MRLLEALRRQRARMTGVFPRAVKKACLALLLLFALGYPTSEACASIADLYGFGARAASLAGAFTAVADDFSAVYYNPAGLTAQRQPLEYMRKHGFRIENGVQFAKPSFYTQEQGREKQKGDLDLFSAISLGVTLEPFDLSGFLPRKCVAFGLGILSPIEYAYWWEREYPREKVFVLHHDYNQHLMLIPAIAVEPIQRLSLGVGINVTIDSTADTYGQVTVDSAELKPLPGGSLFGSVDITPSSNQLGQFANIKAKFAPIVGILWQPTSWLRCGFAYRGELYFDDKGTNDILLRVMLPARGAGPGAAEIDLPIFFPSRFARYYMPEEVSWAVALMPTEALLVTVDITWMRWSGYIPQIRTPVSFDQFVIEPGFKDTVVPRVGLEYRVAPKVSLLGGYNFQKSPVPDQPGYLNFVDNDRHVASLGFEYAYRGFRLQGYYQHQWAMNRLFEKEAMYGPSYRAAGYAYSFGLNLCAAF